MTPSNNSSDTTVLTLRADRLGIIASAVCFVHCIATPVVLSMSSVWAYYLPSEEKFHRVFAILVAAIGAFAILTGFRKHRRARVLMLLGAGLALIFAGAFGHGYFSRAAEIAVTMAGSCLLISTHFLNHTFCKNCACAHE